MSIGLAVSVLECPSVPEVAGFHSMLGARITRMDTAVERRLHVAIGGGEVLYVERRGMRPRPVDDTRLTVCILVAVSPQALYVEFARRMRVSCGEVLEHGAPALHPEDRAATGGDRYPGVALVDPAGNLIRFVRMGYFDRFRPGLDAALLSA